MNEKMPGDEPKRILFPDHEGVIHTASSEMEAGQMQHDIREDAA